MYYVNIRSVVHYLQARCMNQNILIHTLLRDGYTVHLKLKEIIALIFITIYFIFWKWNT